MCVSIPIEGRHQIKNDRHQALMAEFMKFSDGSDQFLQGERGVTYVSRLQCVQSALEQQIKEVQKEFSNKKIGLVTFNSDVTLYGDGASGQPLTITGDKLNNYDVLLEQGVTEGGKRLQKTIKDTAEQLEASIMQI